MGKKRYVGFGEFNILDTFVRSNRDLMSVFEIKEVAGYEYNYVYSVMRRLIKLDLVVRHSHGDYVITESGRIVHALKAAGMIIRNARRRASRAGQDKKLAA